MPLLKVGKKDESNYVWKIDVECFGRHVELGVSRKDIAHLKAKGENPAQLIKKYKDRLAYVHLKDWDEKSKSFVPLGDGCVDIKGALKALDEIGYDGWLTIELDEPKVEPKVAMGRSLNFLKE